MTIHSISNSLFAIEGDRAEGEHYAMAFHRSRGPDARELIIWGRYLDHYERRAGEWKFLKRQLVFDHGTIKPVDAEGMAVLSADAQNGTDDAQDPSWAMALLKGLSPQ
jgi:hypothetical protein